MSARPLGLSAARRKGRILLVEDDALSRKLMKDALEASGHEVAQSRDGAEALAIAAVWMPDVIVMDIGLPGMTGVEATRTLKANPTLARVPVVAVTAYAMPADEGRMREAGCEVFLTKPLRLSDFVQALERLLPGSQVHSA
jgi:two-component system cell cycle response regulator DivK